MHIKQHPPAAAFKTKCAVSGATEHNYTVHLSYGPMLEEILLDAQQQKIQKSMLYSLFSNTNTPKYKFTLRG